MARFEHQRIVVAGTFVSIATATVAFVIGLMAFVGYLNGNARLYTWLRGASGLAFNTSIALICISAAVIVQSMILSIVVNEMTKGDIRYVRKK